jgi:hypothetical protein
MNGERQMKKTSRTNNTQSNVRKGLTPVKPWECKTIYTTFKRVRLTKGLLITNKPVNRAGCDKLISSPDDKCVSGISMVTFYPPCERKSQLSLSLPLPILSIHLTLESSPLPLTCEQGAGSVGSLQPALRPALSLWPLWPLWFKKQDN